MKLFIITFCFFCFSVVAEPAIKRMRVWNNKTEDAGDIHSMGNGKIVAYGQGPDLIEFYGPPYSSPKILYLETLADEEITNLIEFIKSLE